METTAYDVDKLGFIVEVLVVNTVDEIPHNIVIQQPPDGLYRARWTGTEWVEGKTQAEFEEDAFNASLSPSAVEIERAEFEIKILTTLMEVGIL